MAKTQRQIKRSRGEKMQAHIHSYRQTKGWRQKERQRNLSLFLFFSHKHTHTNTQCVICSSLERSKGMANMPPLSFPTKKTVMLRGYESNKDHRVQTGDTGDTLHNRQKCKQTMTTKRNQQLPGKDGLILELCAYILQD